MTIQIDCPGQLARSIQSSGHLHPAPDRQHHQHKTHHRRGSKRKLPLVQEIAHRHRNDDKGCGRKHRSRERRRIGHGLTGIPFLGDREHHRDDIDEHTHGQGDTEEYDQVKQCLGPGADDALGDLADGHTLGPHTDHQRPEVVHATDKDRADDHPQHGRQPAPDDRYGRSQHGRQPVIDAQW